MRKVLLIVARDRTDLYEYFKHGFEFVEGIDVILDRRVHLGGRMQDRGIASERRAEIDLYEELQFRGFIICPLK